MEKNELGTEKIYRATIKAIEKFNPSTKTLNHLDIGAGTGELIRLLQETKHGITSSACDYTDSLMKLQDQRVDIVDLNKNVLPYQDMTFDIVTATEVIEHLENPRSFLRDINRVLKPSGLLILSTPNVLNLNSRIRYLCFGFPRLFGPLPIGKRKIEFCLGHISPISCFYLYHSLIELGFSDIEIDIDKYQRSGMVKLVIFYWPIKLTEMLIKKREVRKNKSIDETNIKIVNQINSLKILLGRTIVVKARKKYNEPPLMTAYSSS
jgi:ubiquinone/menaquinone biosynthesis C-methylase UbiE